MGRKAAYSLVATAAFCAYGCTIQQPAADHEDENTLTSDDDDVSDPDSRARLELTQYLDALPNLSHAQALAPTRSPCRPEDGCTNEPVPAATEFACGYELTREVAIAAEHLVALGPDPDLWPGNLLRGTAAARRVPSLEAVPLDLGAVTLSSTLLGSTSQTVEVPTTSAYHDALATFLANRERATGSAVGSQMQVEAIFSEEDLSSVLGVDLDFLVASGISAQLDLESRSSTMTTHAKVAVSFVQSFFQVTADPHSISADYFGEGVTAADVERTLGDDDVPVHVRSVTYGRRVVAVFEDAERTDSEEFAAEISAAYVPVAGDISFTETSSVGNRQMSALVLGDDRTFTDVDDLFAYLNEPPDLATAWPIGYTLQYLGGQAPFEVAITTEVVTKSCEECGSSDMYADHRSLAAALEIHPEGPISDADSDFVQVEGGVLPPAQERWFTALGSDDAVSIVDPQASLSSGQATAEVCIFADCESGPTDVVCTFGDYIEEGTLHGCCSALGDAQFTGGEAGLCPDKVSDDARVYVRVRLDTEAGECVEYDLTVHY